ncbi:MAG: polysaccharide deacetylase family protein [Clostridiales bacterium]|nr:polysaccharide deacetylase family protein [Clostridiales bacterium]
MKKPGRLTLVLLIIIMTAVFAGGVLASAATQKSGVFVRDVYEEILGRQPSEEELDYYVELMNCGRYHACDVIHAVAFSKEGRAVLAGDDRFVSSVYKIATGKEPDELEKRVYVLSLKNGSGREKIFAMILGREEYEKTCSDYGVNPGTVIERREIDPNKPMVALTFDDGPSQYTKSVVRRLFEYDSRATFFMLGQNVDDYPKITAKESSLGFELGNHTRDHKDLASLDEDGINYQINEANRSIYRATGRSATVIRPPYGSYDDLVKETVNRPLLYWSVDSRDWETRDQVSDYKALTQTVKDGDVVLMHDIYAPTARAAWKAIPELIDNGFQLVTVSELAEYRGGMRNGVVYFSFRNQ